MFEESTNNSKIVYPIKPHLIHLSMEVKMNVYIIIIWYLIFNQHFWNHLVLDKQFVLYKVMSLLPPWSFFLICYTNYCFISNITSDKPRLIKAFADFMKPLCIKVFL